MSNGKNPLMLMMALTMPGAAHALGLGEIHVDSALNERLAAEIDIVGATALELTDLRAAVANRETFLRYGADRPPFLSSATFKVSQDSQGRPVLAVRSSESFTEPVVNLLVDLHWSHGEVVRQYTLLLDPAVFASAPSAPQAPDVPAAPPAATPIVETKTQTVARQADPPSAQPTPLGTERAVRKTRQIKVGAKATLRGIAWRVGERSESDLQKMMLAIFRANPGAFDGNINRLYRGALLTIPSHAELATISKAEARREIHAQMAAWHSPVRAIVVSGAMSAAAVPPTATPSAVAAATSAAGSLPGTAASGQTSKKATETPVTAELERRVQSMQQELIQMKDVLDSEHDQMLELEQRAARTPQVPSVAGAPQTTQPGQATAMFGEPQRGYAALIPVAVGLTGVLAAALTAVYFKLRRRAAKMKGSRNPAGAPAHATSAEVATTNAAAVNVAAAIAREASAATTLDTMADALLEGREDLTLRLMQDRAQASAADEATQSLLSVGPGIEPAGSQALSRSISQESRTASPQPDPRGGSQDPTVNLHVDTVNMRMDSTRLDYNLVDLDLTAQHVQMPSVLNEHPVMKERRTNLADVLKLAIEREPDRHDLRMKLLELYYSAAATNRKAFLETVQKFARDRDYLQTDQWDKIAYMGRQIASDNPLFAEVSADDDDLADCA